MGSHNAVVGMSKTSLQTKFMWSCMDKVNFFLIMNKNILKIGFPV